MGEVVTRIPSHVEKVGSKVFRKKTDCDFAGSVLGRAVFFDAKVIQVKRFNIQSLILRDTKIHQYRFLKMAHDRGAFAGYLIWFTKEQRIAFLRADKVMDFGNSFTSEDLINVADDKPIAIENFMEVV